VVTSSRVGIHQDELEGRGHEAFDPWDFETYLWIASPPRRTRTDNPARRGPDPGLPHSDAVCQPSRLQGRILARGGARPSSMLWLVPLHQMRWHPILTVARKDPSDPKHVAVCLAAMPRPCFGANATIHSASRSRDRIKCSRAAIQQLCPTSWWYCVNALEVDRS
jgi:hypothetical protein